MDLKKLTFSDQLLSSPRRKLVSRFSFGIVLSFIALSVVLFNISFKAPFLSPVFPGLNSIGSHSNSGFLSWPFSTGFSASGNISSGCNDTGIVQKLQHPVGVNETLEANLVVSNKSLDFVNSDGKDKVFENANVRNVSEKFKDGNLGVGEGSVSMKSDEKNGSQTVKNSTLMDSSGKGMDSSENGNSESFCVKENALKGNLEGKTVNENLLAKSGGCKQISKLPKIEASENGNVGNHSENEDIGDLRHKDVNFVSTNRNSFKDCDIFNGRWVRDDTKPYYPLGSCPYIGKDFDCHLTGRPDNEFVKWRWQPCGCDIPIFNATEFLKRLRGKKLVFVGDSLNRNMWESLVCMLRHGVQDKKRVYEISGRRDFKKKGFYAFRFEDYNCSVDFVSSPFLVREASFNGTIGSFETLRLDLMDGTTSMYHDADVIVFNTGHWWTHEKTSRGEDYYQEGNYVHPRLRALEAYKRALATWGNWVDKNIDGSKTQVIFRGYSVTHFRGGWPMELRRTMPQ